MKTLIEVRQRLAFGDVQATLTLPFELRQRSRLRTSLDDGRDVALVLERGRALRGGDLLGSECGLCIEVLAGKEAVSGVRTTVAESLARVAYHLGNRHVALEVRRDELRYLADHVLDEMVRGLGLEVLQDELPFEPEGGAYDHDEPAHAHGH